MARATLLALTTDRWSGHEVFYIAAPTTKADGDGGATSKRLAGLYHPSTVIRDGWFDRNDIDDWRSFYDTRKAEQMLGWKHEE